MAIRRFSSFALSHKLTSQIATSAPRQHGHSKLWIYGNPYLFLTTKYSRHIVSLHPWLISGVPFPLLRRCLGEVQCAALPRARHRECASAAGRYRRVGTRVYHTGMSHECQRSANRIVSTNNTCYHSNAIQYTSHSSEAHIISYNMWVHYTGMHVCAVKDERNGSAIHWQSNRYNVFTIADAQTNKSSVEYSDWIWHLVCFSLEEL